MHDLFIMQGLSEWEVKETDEPLAKHLSPTPLSLALTFFFFSASNQSIFRSGGERMFAVRGRDIKPLSKLRVPVVFSIWLGVGVRRWRSASCGS